MWISSVPHCSVASFIALYVAFKYPLFVTRFQTTVMSLMTSRLRMSCKLIKERKKSDDKQTSLTISKYSKFEPSLMDDVFKSYLKPIITSFSDQITL